MTVSRISVAVIGGGPAGIAAAIAASEQGASVLLIEHDKRLGGKLKQSIHDGFGFIRYDEELTGPEYAFRDITALEETNTFVLLETTVVNIISITNAFQLTLSNRHGVSVVEANSVVLATGCREKTVVESGIHGTRPAGVFTAGEAQYYMNIAGKMPVKNCIMLGSNNLSLVTARRLVLEGSKILSIYEPMSAPVGYITYVNRCLLDFNTEIHFQHTITRTFGTKRLQGVELSRTGNDGQPVRGSEIFVKCDGYIHSDGFIPQNRLAVSLGAEICDITNGPFCDQNRMTTVDGIFSCGNGLHVSSLVDYVTESGEIAGRAAAGYILRPRELLKIDVSNAFLTFSPQYIDCDMFYGETVFYFTTAIKYENAIVQVYVGSTEVFSGDFEYIQPYETQRISVNLSGSLAPESNVSIRISQSAPNIPGENAAEDTVENAPEDTAESTPERESAAENTVESTAENGVSYDE